VLARLADGARPLAGGTDAVLWAMHWGEHRSLVWTGGVEELRILDPEGDGNMLRVGSAVTLAQIVRSPAFRAAAPAVADGARAIGSVQLRNQATLVGNVCTASPAGDTIPGLLVHDAVVEVVNVSGQRRHLSLDDLLVGPGRTKLKDDDLVVALGLSRLGPREASAYLRFTQRRALDLAVASVAARLELEPDGRTVAALRLALGAVGPIAFDAGEAAALLVGRPMSDAGFGDCARAAAAACSPISDHRASADYRRQLVRALVADAIAEAARRVMGAGRYGFAS
jgi:carbon-monoxide dehydrogenase medium subunit